MQNILRWNPPAELQGAEVTYTVQYFIYGQKKWLSKPECRNINRTYCDLSVETSDYEHQYYAKVKAMWETNCSRWAETTRFYPFLETQIGPPEVALTTGEKSISITLTAPEKWKRNPEDSTVSMQQIYPNLKYNVSVYNTKSKRMWSQSITNHTLVLSWLEPSTLYCVQLEAFVPGPPRLIQPSHKQCVSTLEDQASALKVRIILWYVLPTSVIMFLLFVIGYSIYRYIHVGKEKHPANLILLYGSELGKRFFVPAEKLVINFITVNILEDSRMSQKDMSLQEKSSSEPTLHAPEPSGSSEPLLEGAEVLHLGYTSHLMDIFRDTEASSRDASLSRGQWLGGSLPAGEAAVADECHVPPDFCQGHGDHPRAGQEEASRPWKSAVANVGPLSPHSPQLSDLNGLVQGHPGLGEGPEEEPSTTLVDWDPQTGRLCIASLLDFDQDPEDCQHHECDRLSEEGLLSRLYEVQAQNKPSEENKNCFVQFMEEWGLHVQMEN
uniref:interleukin-20 receptor subunit alpha n=1 Tax=Jaculus jaculus TaxID=51337 RepID=UPI001E1B5B5A|nr:interleukin-20 receptor subunit alpha [Jaculus jaculus]